jgi:2,5-diketo-D-gluconate reductase A
VDFPAPEVPTTEIRRTSGERTSRRRACPEALCAPHHRLLVLVPGWDNGQMAEARDNTEVDLGGGVTMPMLGLGTWRLSGKRGYQAMRYALEVGYRHLDTATMYRNEDDVGRAVRDSGLDRRDVFITTKLLPGDAGREREAIQASLRALGTTYVDLWLVHWPPRDRGAMVRAWKEFIAVRGDGLARAIGVSNFAAGQIDELVDATGERPAVNQIPYSLPQHDPKLLAAMRERRVAVEGYSPLKNTNLRDQTLADVASRYHVTPAQVVLRWHLQHGIAVIPKSGTPERILSNFAVFGFSLSDDDMALLDAVSGR